jgi:SAM-dependent methyltransferase
MPTPSQATAVANWEREERQPFSGWDFSHLAGRWREEHPSWSYGEIARTLLRASTAALDLGTGGGERLAAMADVFPTRVAATEGWAPNVEIARRRLDPLDVDVVGVGGGTDLPFPDRSFDLVLDRHTAFDAAEVARVLRPGGTFLTQQVDGRNLADLIERFGAQPQFPDITLERLSGQLRGAGFVIDDARDQRLVTTFDDVGALVYYLRAVPWTVLGFSVATHRRELLALQAQLDAGAPLAFTSRRFLISGRLRAT